MYRFGMKLMVPTLIAVGMLLATCAGATSWNLADDFNVTTNSGVWTYGYYGPDRNITLYGEVMHNEIWAGDNVWRVPGNYDVAGNVIKNTGAFFEGPWGGVYEPGSVVMQGDWRAVGTPDPGAVVVRWTSTIAGNLSIHVVFTGEQAPTSDKAQQSNVYVYKGGVTDALASGLIDGFVGRSINGFTDVTGPTPMLTYDITNVTVGVGDVIDFAAIGLNSPRIGVAATIVGTPIIPEPSSLLALSVSLAGLLGFVARRRRG
ncbi:MAG: PEP-CTERM sorting domain-containing protein [Armatimonadota bacterium]